MRINFAPVILTLAVASSVYAAPAPAHLAKRNWVSDKLKDLVEKALNTLECGACTAALVGVKDVAWLNKNWVIDALSDICPKVSKLTPEVCTGSVKLEGPALLDALLKADLLSGDAKFICYQVAGICAPPSISSGSLKFPKPRPANAVPPASSGKLIDVLHLSDWHVDAGYIPGSEAECDQPLCCRKHSNSPAVPKRKASTWGDYHCDVPIKLGQNMMTYVPTVANVSFGILTGDVPPHDIWAQTQQTVVPQTANAYGVMATLGTKIYPTIGNHEAGPSNLYPTTSSGGSVQWLYNSLADDWSRWLPAEAVSSVKSNYGAYNVSPAPGLRIISLNTNFCYNMNFYLYAEISDYDPNGELKWLVVQLQAAEDAGERVWIIGHVSPSMTSCIMNWSSLYYQAVQRYSPHVIAEQFFGHSHYDEFALSYGPGAKTAQNAIATAWIGPSTTTYTNLNPGFRTYKVDTKSWNIFDSQTYIADMNLAPTWDATGATPNWHLEYSARQTYSAYVPIADDKPLSASWWHDVTKAFETNPAAFQTYWKLRSKSSGLQLACPAGGPCPAEMICNLRAGKSSDSCTKIALKLSRRSDVDSEVTPVAAVIAGANRILKRSEPAAAAQSNLWNENLCI
ncbi:hypothetical protein KI688_011516 [Linnemannia hyalina]|uniref:Sphingomyelin phosphodiesterase n=1 Tax=Linnemannia hyalina TaxID=64524 RepID=A0A9P7XVA3_9FUNG|nr:hypothetical protein KI688_011516 [Linnemannia hyalina]